MHDIWAEIIQVEDLSWDIHMKWYGNEVILNAFASASEALGELMSLYPGQSFRLEVLPYTTVKEIANAG